jgi:large subunit ribosomal protein L25
MAEITITAEGGRPTGSRAANRLRAAGRIPGVIYGHGQTPLPVSVDGRELRAALTTEAGLNALLSLKLEGLEHLTLAREIQRHPVRNTVIHVDFQIVRRDEVVTAEVPINLIGDAHEVTVNEGFIEQPLSSLTVRATPGRIPNVLEVDISHMTIGDAIRVSDLSLPSGVTTEVDPEEAVVIAERSKVAAEIAEAEEAAEAAEAEAAEAAAEGAPEAAAAATGPSPAGGEAEGGGSSGGEG